MLKSSSSSRTFWKGVLNFLFPPFCPGCGAYLGFWADARSVCRACSAALRAAAKEYPHWMTDPRGLDGLWSLAPYGSEPLTGLIHKMKYQSKDWVLEGIHPVLEEFLPSSGLQHLTDWVVPVPLHESRLRERGFNQAGRIAQRICGLFQMELKEDVLLKAKRTGPQAKIEGDSQRIKNISGSFLSKDAGGRKILLVDDVYTSGATMAEAARALRAAGAVKVFGFTLTRGKF